MCITVPNLISCPDVLSASITANDYVIVLMEATRRAPLRMEF